MAHAPQPTKAPALTLKQEAFVREYLVDLNAAAAARRAGYSERSARQIATENLSKPAIQQAIEEGYARRAERTEMDQDWVVAQLRQTQAEARARGQFGPATKGLELLGKHQGMFSDKTPEKSPSDLVGTPLEIVLRGLSNEQLGLTPEGQPIEDVDPSYDAGAWSAAGDCTSEPDVGESG